MTKWMARLIVVAIISTAPIVCSNVSGSTPIEADAQLSRGIDSFQIVHARGRFWIASPLFEDERPGLTLPAKYLKTPGQ